MNISAAKAFLAVVSVKSISKAAEILFLSQSTVSFQLKMLEEELGVILIERHKGYRQIGLTTKGQEFISIAERFVQLWQEAHALQYRNTATLTIRGVDSVNTYIFAPFYQQFLQSDSTISLKVLTHQTPEIFELVENRFADIGLVLSQRRYSNVITKPIFQEHLYYVQMQDKTANKKGILSIHPYHLNFRKEILFDWGPEFSQWHSTWCNPNVHPALQVDTITMLMHFLKDDYWTILPTTLIDILKKNYPISGCPIEEGPPDRICYKLKHRFPPPSQQSSIEILEEKLDEFLKQKNLRIFSDR